MRRRGIGMLSTALSVSFVLGCSPNSKPTEPASSRRMVTVPDGWAAASPAGFAMGLDRGEHRSGNAAFFITGTAMSTNNTAVLSQFVRVDSYLGKRVRLSGWVKQEGVLGTNAGLWMRIDGPGVTLQFDNMAIRPLNGTADWHQVSVVLDVPPSALGIALGVLSNAQGTLLVDDLRLEEVGTEVPSTNALSTYVTSIDSAAMVAAYSHAANTPLNLDFEGVAPLTMIVGDAHLVRMGGDTHAKRRFFQAAHQAAALESGGLSRSVLTRRNGAHLLLAKV